MTTDTLERIASLPSLLEKEPVPMAIVKRVYIASPYGRRIGNTDTQCQLNVDRAIGYARILIQQGYYPFVPVLYHYIHKDWDDSPDEPRWHELCGEWLTSCHVVLRVSGFSLGADEEVERAKELGIPVVYSLKELQELR